MVIATEFRVIYGDTDNMGVVYYANYLRYFEIGRNEYMRGRGLPYREIEGKGLSLPVTDATCKYHRPARYDDLVRLETRVTRARGARVTFAYTLWNESGELLAEGTTDHGSLGKTGRPVRIPPGILAALAAEDT